MPNRTEVVSQKTEQPSQGFFGLGIAPKILSILEQIKFKAPTPIQAKVIPLAIQGQDIVGIAQTGTGKTLAFVIPIVQTLAQKDICALVLAPTRELALQIEEVFREIMRPFGMKTACLIGGAPMPPQIMALQRDPRVVIATPGRLFDHLERHSIVLNGVGILVLDEADRMLDMGFAPQVDKIVARLPKKRQTMLFSATMAREIMTVASRYMKLPVSIEIAPPGTTVQEVTQELFIVAKEAKLKLLGKILGQYPGSVLLFTRMKHHAHKIAYAIREMGYRAAEIHSNRSLNQRREALDGFKSGRYKVLVATDIASRGIDVTGIELVINYDLPDETENYIHRIGRTARAGHKGRAISFATPDQSRDVQAIERLTRTTLKISEHPGITHGKFSLSSTPVGHTRFGGGYGGRSRPSTGRLPAVPRGRYTGTRAFGKT
ncbi:MAG: DEAD/DEAH box helicase [Candidatus Brocadiia bacterium]